MAPVFLFLVVFAVLCGAATGRLDLVTQASLDEAKKAVEVAIGLVGVMAFWLGMVEVIRRAGLLSALARGLAPVFHRLFPDVPDGHPAVAAMSLNIAANMLGLTNAATPLGIDAMRQLDRLNGQKGTSTDAMALFLAINTSGVALLPLGVIGLRASIGSTDAAGIILTTLFATTLSTASAIVAAKLLCRLPRFRATRPPVEVETAGEGPSGDDAQGQGAAGAPVKVESAELPPAAGWRRAVAWIGWLAAAALAVAVLVGTSDAALSAGAIARNAVSWLPLPLIILAIVLYGWAKAVPVYEAVVDGAKEGFNVALRIIPYLVAILVAVGMFRGSGALDALVGALGPITSAIGFPSEALPMALIRPLSGSGAFAVLADILKTHGPDSFVGYLASTLQGSFETTFYVLAVYGGAVALRRSRHTVAACLIGDFFGIVGATIACRWLIGF